MKTTSRLSKLIAVTLISSVSLLLNASAFAAGAQHQHGINGKSHKNVSASTEMTKDIPARTTGAEKTEPGVTHKHGINGKYHQNVSGEVAKKDIPARTAGSDGSKSDSSVEHDHGVNAKGHKNTSK